MFDFLYIFSYDLLKIQEDVIYKEVLEKTLAREEKVYEGNYRKHLVKKAV